MGSGAEGELPPPHIRPAVDFSTSTNISRRDSITRLAVEDCARFLSAFEDLPSPNSFYRENVMSRVYCFAFASLSLIFLGPLAACHSSAADNPPGGPRGPGGGGPGGFNLFANETVEKDLALTEAQKESIKSISDDFRSSIRDLSQEDRQSKMPELRKAMEDKIGAVLTDKQKARMKEIRLQVQGSGALSTKEVAAALNLTDEQVKQITDLTKSLDDARRELLQGPDGPDPDAREKLTQLRTDTDAKILAVLTPGQKASFEQMKGSKIDLPQGGFGRGGFGPGGPGGGGPGGGGPGGGPPRD
jgi:Spy/CpxP family protein refolding chaperone